MLVTIHFQKWSKVIVTDYDETIQNWQIDRGAGNEIKNIKSVLILKSISIRLVSVTGGSAQTLFPIALVVRCKYFFFFFWGGGGAGYCYWHYHFLLIVVIIVSVCRPMCHDLAFILVTCVPLITQTSKSAIEAKRIKKINKVNWVKQTIKYSCPRSTQRECFSSEP